MKLTRHVSVAIMFAAMSVAVPALAAAPAGAKLVQATATDVMPVANVVGMIGTWHPADLTSLDKAAMVKVFDTKSLYPAADQSQIAKAETAKTADLGKFRSAIKADTTLSAWLTANKIDVNRVIALSDVNGNAEIFLY